MGGDVGGVVVARQPSLGGLATALPGRLLEPDLFALSSHGGHHLFINRIPPRLPKEDVEKIILAQLRLHPFVLQVSRCSVIPQNSLKNKGYGFITLDGAPSPSDLDAIADSLNNKLQVGCRTLGVRVCTDCHSACYGEDDATASSSSNASTPPNEPGSGVLHEMNVQEPASTLRHADCRQLSPMQANGHGIASGTAISSSSPPRGETITLQPGILQTAVAALAKQGVPMVASVGPRRRKAGKHQHAYPEHSRCLQHKQYSHSYQPAGFLDASRAQQGGMGQVGHGTANAVGRPWRRASDINPALAAIDLDERSRSAEPQFALQSPATPSRELSPAGSRDVEHLQPPSPVPLPQASSSDAATFMMDSELEPAGQEQAGSVLPRQDTGCAAAATGAGDSPRSVSSYGSSTVSAAGSVPHSGPGSVSGSGSGSTHESAAGSLILREDSSEPRAATVSAALAPASTATSRTVASFATHNSAAMFSTGDSCPAVEMAAGAQAEEAQAEEAQAEEAQALAALAQAGTPPVAAPTQEAPEGDVPGCAPHRQPPGTQLNAAQDWAQGFPPQHPASQYAHQQQQQQHMQPAPPAAPAAPAQQLGQVRQTHISAKQVPAPSAASVAKCALRAPVHGLRPGPAVTTMLANAHGRGGRAQPTAGRGAFASSVSGQQQVAGWQSGALSGSGPMRPTQMASASAPSSSSWYIHQYHKRQLHENQRHLHQARCQASQAGAPGAAAQPRGSQGPAAGPPAEFGAGDMPAGPVANGTRRASAGGGHEAVFGAVAAATTGARPSLQPMAQQTAPEPVFQRVSRQAWADRTEGFAAAEGLGLAVDRRGSYPGGGSAGARSQPHGLPPPQQQQQQPCLQRRSQPLPQRRPQEPQTQMQAQLQQHARSASHSVTLATANRAQHPPSVGFHQWKPQQQLQQQPPGLHLQGLHQQQQQHSPGMFFHPPSQQQPQQQHMQTLCEGLQALPQQQHGPLQSQHLQRRPQEGALTQHPASQQQHPAPEQQRQGYFVQHPFVQHPPQPAQPQISRAPALPQPPQQQQQPPQQQQQQPPQQQQQQPPQQQQQQPSRQLLAHLSALKHVSGASGILGGNAEAQPTAMISSSCMPSTSPASVAPLLSLQLLMSAAAGTVSDSFLVGSPAPHGLSVSAGLVDWHLDLDFRSRPSVADLQPQQQQRHPHLPDPAQPPGSRGPVAAAGPAAAAVTAVDLGHQRSADFLLGRGSSDGVEDPEADSAESADLNPLDFEPMILQLLENDDDDDCAAPPPAARRPAWADQPPQQQPPAGLPALLEHPQFRQPPTLQPPQQQQQQPESFMAMQSSRVLSTSAAPSAGTPPGLAALSGVCVAASFKPPMPAAPQQQLHQAQQLRQPQQPHQQHQHQQHVSGGHRGMPGEGGAVSAGVAASWNAPSCLTDGGSRGARPAAGFTQMSGGMAQTQNARAQQPQPAPPSARFGPGPSPAGEGPPSALWPRGPGQGPRGRGAAVVGSFPGARAGSLAAAAGAHRRGGPGGGGRGAGGVPRGGVDGGFRGGGRHYGGRGPSGLGGYGGGGRGAGPRAAAMGGTDPVGSSMGAAGGGRPISASAAGARPAIDVAPRGVANVPVSGGGMLSTMGYQR